METTEKDGLDEGFDDLPIEFESLSKEDRTELLAWIAATLKPSRRIYASPSYRMKHDFEGSGGTYVTNGAFKGAMLLSGFMPVDCSVRNWQFRCVVVK